MTKMRQILSLAVFATFVCSCGGGGGTTDTGIVQVTTFIVSPGTVNCGVSNTVPLSENASPDTVAIRAELVNTTKDSVSLDSAGVVGVVTRSTFDSTEVGRIEFNYPNIPFHPTPIALRPLDGDVNPTISLPVTPLCNMHINAAGTQDVQITARLTTSVGLYTTAPTTLHVSWQGQ